MPLDPQRLVKDQVMEIPKKKLKNPKNISMHYGQSPGGCNFLSTKFYMVDVKDSITT